MERAKRNYLGSLLVVCHSEEVEAGNALTEAKEIATAS